MTSRARSPWCETTPRARDGSECALLEAYAPSRAVVVHDLAVAAARTPDDDRASQSARDLSEVGAPRARSDARDPLLSGVGTGIVRGTLFASRRHGEDLGGPRQYADAGGGVDRAETPGPGVPSIGSMASHGPAADGNH